jgi:hypothetical protein
MIFQISKMAHKPNGGTGRDKGRVPTENPNTNKKGLQVEILKPF